MFDIGRNKIKKMNHYTLLPFSYPVNWAIKRDPVYRLLDDERWMDNFFETGELLISCFDKFKNYPNEMQGDKEEGEAFIRGEDAVGNQHFILYDSGDNAFVMSTTTQIKKQVIDDFNAKCAIKINNPTEFALEIAKKLPFVSSGVEGNCIYDEDRILRLKRSIEDYAFFEDGKFINDRLGMEAFREETREYELFLKREMYKHQNEYRFVWFTGKKVKDSCFISCPEAIQFCEKVKI